MTEPKKVLHICNWYPNQFDDLEGIFVKTQIDALHPFIYSDVMHIQVKHGSLAWLAGKTSERERYWILVAPIRSARMIELLTSAMLIFFLLFQFRSKNYRLINFHIAYPLLAFSGMIKPLIKLPILITEHWSAYRFNFGTKKELKRIKKIFFTYDKLISVSSALADDIKTFSGNPHLKWFILPNGLEQIFLNTTLNRQFSQLGFYRFFMLSAWEKPKDPFAIINVLAKLNQIGFNFTLRIGGYGTYETEMKNLITRLNLTDKIKFIGRVNTQQIIQEFQQTDYFLHASAYETFSIVCLEALSQGVPVVASNVGGIPDFVNENNGILVEANDEASWQQAIQEVIKRKFDPMEIATKIRAQYSTENIGKEYQSIIESVIRS